MNTVQVIALCIMFAAILSYCIYEVKAAKDSKKRNTDPTRVVSHRISLRIRTYEDYDKVHFDIARWYMSICEEFGIEGKVEIPLDDSPIVTLTFDSSTYVFEQIKERVSTFCDEYDTDTSIKYKF